MVSLLLALMGGVRCPGGACSPAYPSDCRARCQRFGKAADVPALHDGSEQLSHGSGVVWSSLW